MTPTEFARVAFNWEAFGYQKEPLNDMSPRQIMACVAEGMDVLTIDGNIPIEKITVGQKVQSLSEGNITWRQVSNVLDRGIKDVYRIRTIEGSELEATSDHRLLCRYSGNFRKYRKDRIRKEGWYSIDDGINNKTQIAVPNKFCFDTYCLDKNLNYGREKAKLLGYMLSDGSYTQTPKFTNNNILYIEEVKNIASALFGSKIKTYNKNRGYDVILSYARGFKEFIDEGYYNCHRLPCDQASLFLNRLFAGDGWVSTWKRKRKNGMNPQVTIGLINKDKEFLKRIKLLLNSKGIGCYITETKGERLQKQPYFKLRISRGKSILRFFVFVGVIFGKEKQSFECIEAARLRKFDRLPENEIFWEQIKSIIYIGKKRCYDLTVDDTHNFIAGNIIVHNCGRQVGKTEIAAIKGLWFAIMNEGKTVLIVSPTQRASSILFRRMKSMITKSAFEKGELRLKDTIARETQSVLEFDNGSVIYSLPASNKGDNLRGFTADLIIIDEGGQIDDDVWGVIRPMLIMTSGVMMVIGTPNGCNNMFYRYFSEDKYQFKKYHFITKMNPKANLKQMEIDYESMADIEWRQEYLGEFVDTADMLFRMVDVEACMQKDNYRVRPEPMFDYYLGYDPATIGQDEACACILEYRPKYSPVVETTPYSVAQMIVMKGKSIPDQITFIEQLHREWNFKGIAIDVTSMGQGLIKEDYKDGRVRISDTIVATGIWFTMKSKQDIFFNLKRLIEAGQIILGKSDKLKKQLVELKGERKPDKITRISHPKHGHDDLATGLALAVWAAKTQVAEVHFARVSSIFK